LDIEYIGRCQPLGYVFPPAKFVKYVGLAEVV